MAYRQLGSPPGKLDYLRSLVHVKPGLHGEVSTGQAGVHSNFEARVKERALLRSGFFGKSFRVYLSVKPPITSQGARISLRDR
jgi:hypothetical protein